MSLGSAFDFYVCVADTDRRRGIQAQIDEFQELLHACREALAKEHTRQWIECKGERIPESCVFA